MINPRTRGRAVADEVRAAWSHRGLAFTISGTGSHCREGGLIKGVTRFDICSKRILWLLSWLNQKTAKPGQWDQLGGYFNNLGERQWWLGLRSWQWRQQEGIRFCVYFYCSSGRICWHSLRQMRKWRGKDDSKAFGLSHWKDEAGINWCGED